MVSGHCKFIGKRPFGKFDKDYTCGQQITAPGRPLVPHPVGRSVARFEDETRAVDPPVASVGGHVQERFHGCFQSRLLRGRQQLLYDASSFVCADGRTLQPLASEMEAAPFDFRHPDRN